MRCVWSALITLGLLGGVGFAAAADGDAQPAPWPAPPATLELQAVDALHQDTTGPRLGNGTVVDPTDWPASFYATYTANGQSFNCTSTLVGPRSLLTASHCIADGGTVAFKRNGQSYTGQCEQAKPVYQSPESPDWAMCLMNQDVPATHYETIDLDVGVLRKNQVLLLAGFGCQQIGGTSDGKFRTGPAFIEYVLGQVTGDPDWIATFAAVARGDAFICPGDSGGAVYYEEPAFPRAVVAVNSHYDTAGKGVSFLAVLGTPAGSAFLKAWAQRHGQRLCGVHDDAPNCLR
jgi:Trypsin